MQAPLTIDDLQKCSGLTTDRFPLRLGVFGDPVAHSLSPRMQNAALQACGIEMQYAAFQIEHDELKTALRLLPSLGFVGVNLTIPHKISGAGLVDELDDFARRCGSINTVRVEGRKLIGCSTDGPGFACAIRSEFGVEFRDLRVLLLGAAGGAGRAIAMQCVLDDCPQLTLVNRTFQKAAHLAEELRLFAKRTRIEAAEWTEPTLRSQITNTDLVINATPLGLNPSDESPLPISAFCPHLLVYDMIYNPARTALLAAAADAGARAANGLSMLLHQGAFAFEKWFDREAPLEVMRAALL